MLIRIVVRTSTQIEDAVNNWLCHLHHICNKRWLIMAELYASQNSVQVWNGSFQSCLEVHYFTAKHRDISFESLLFILLCDTLSANISINRNSVQHSVKFTERSQGWLRDWNPSHVRKAERTGIIKPHKSRLMGHLTNVCKYQKRPCTQDKSAMFSVSTRGSINIRKRFFTVRGAELCNKFYREVVESPSLKI